MHKERLAIGKTVAQSSVSGAIKTTNQVWWQSHRTVSYRHRIQSVVSGDEGCMQLSLNSNYNAICCLAEPTNQCDLRTLRGTSVERRRRV